jgi:hypothetical protein
MNKEELKKYKKEWYLKNRERQLELCRIRYINNREKAKKWKKEYYSKNKKHLIAMQQLYYKKNIDKYREQRRIRYLKNRNTVLQKNKQYRAKQESKNLRNKYEVDRRNRDSLYKLKTNIRNATYRAFKLKSISKKSKTSKYLGCTWEVLLAHLKYTAIKNYGKYSKSVKYHIDHIKPLLLAKTEKDLIPLLHYTNLQLLKVKDNLKKGAKYDHT